MSNLTKALQAVSAKKKPTTVFIFPGYQSIGTASIRVETGGKSYKLDTDYVESMLARMIEKRGFTTSKKPRQRIERLIINT